MVSDPCHAANRGLTDVHRNHNWFQCLSEPLPRIGVVPSDAPISSLSPLQRAHLAFYQALISTTRLLGGSVRIAFATAEPSCVAAVLLFLPPHRRATATQLRLAYRSGMLSAILGYGPRGAYRVLATFEGNVERMFKSGLEPLGWKQEQCGFVQMIARNPEWHGEKGAAGKLLEYEMTRHWDQNPGVPVILDTTTDAGVRVYERIGFQEIGCYVVDTGTDELGIATNDIEAKERARSVTKQRVMVKIP